MVPSHRGSVPVPSKDLCGEMRGLQSMSGDQRPTAGKPEGLLEVVPHLSLTLQMCRNWVHPLATCQHVRASPWNLAFVGPDLGVG